MLVKNACAGTCSSPAKCLSRILGAEQPAAPRAELCLGSPPWDGVEGHRPQTVKRGEGRAGARGQGLGQTWQRRWCCGGSAAKTWICALKMTNLLFLWCKPAESSPVLVSLGHWMRTLGIVVLVWGRQRGSTAEVPVSCSGTARVDCSDTPCLSMS